MSLRGLNQFMSRLNKEIRKIENRTLDGLIRAAIIVHRDTENTVPKTPVDIGNLRASFFYVASDGRAESSPSFSKGPGASGRKISQKELAMLSDSHTKIMNTCKTLSKVVTDGPAVILGYSAYYAIFVHEMVNAVNWTRPGSGPKWFEASFRRNRGEILNIIRRTARVLK